MSKAPCNADIPIEAIGTCSDCGTSWYGALCLNCMCDHWKDETKLVYLAYAIDNASGMGEDFVEDVVSILSKWFTIYDPGRAFSRTSVKPTLSPKIVDINMEVVSESDLLVAIWNPSIPSVGVPLEITFAIRRNTPVMVVTKNVSAIENSVFMRKFLFERSMALVTDIDSIEPTLAKLGINVFHTTSK